MSQFANFYDFKFNRINYKLFTNLFDILDYGLILFFFYCWTSSYSYIAISTLKFEDIRKFLPYFYDSFTGRSIVANNYWGYS